jgi:hypothetical protein
MNAAIRETEPVILSVRRLWFGTSDSPLNSSNSGRLPVAAEECCRWAIHQQSAIYRKGVAARLSKTVFLFFQTPGRNHKIGKIKKNLAPKSVLVETGTNSKLRVFPGSLSSFTTNAIEDPRPDASNFAASCRFL